MNDKGSCMLLPSRLSPRQTGVEPSGEGSNRPSQKTKIKNLKLMYSFFLNNTSSSSIIHKTKKNKTQVSNYNYANENNGKQPRDTENEKNPS